MRCYEVGPIRPPSEARSLLLRVTRNCPHNRCAFCPVYKGQKFSIRKVEQVQADLREMGRVADVLRETSEALGLGGELTVQVLRKAAHRPDLQAGFSQVAHFLADGGRNVFLQDANSLVMPAEQLLAVLETLREVFPGVERVTSYARAHTLTKRSPEQLRALCEAGLNRIHVGLESGSDEVLVLIQKGVDAERQIEAGKRVKAAGMELSEYLMPGLGGRTRWREHAVQSARVLSAIDPHFIRLRTTAVPPGTELERLVAEGQMEPMDDEETVAEIRLFIEELEATSLLQSDHILNLLGELEGQLPQDKPRLLAIIDRFEALPDDARRAFVLARRAGIVGSLSSFELPEVREHAMRLLAEVRAHYGDDLRAAVRDLMSQFV